MAILIAARTAATTSHDAIEDSLRPFLQHDFHPADYLNTTLPALSTSSGRAQGASHAQPASVTLPELSTLLQTLLSQLNAQTARLSGTLTQLTDEIIRSGSRLAYEVEMLRGDATGLTDTLENGLKKDLELFAPTNVEAKSEDESERVVSDGNVEVANGVLNSESNYLDRLQSLTAVRSRLESVIKVFGDAMAWPLAPSELSLTSSLISVSAPEAGGQERNREEKGKEYIEKLRGEINEIIGAGNDIGNLEAAATRVEELRQLAEIWKGTAEEKARLKLVESLQKPIAERLKVLEKTASGRRPGASPARGIDYRYGNLDASRSVVEGGYGFLQNLRNLKNDVYLE